MSTVQDAPPLLTTGDDAVVASAGFCPYVITAEVFERMLEAEVFPDEARVELWDGRVVEKLAKQTAHAAALTKLNYALFRLLREGYLLSVENPLGVGQIRVPLPDLVVQRGSIEEYLERRPDASDIALTVELADSSLRYDTTKKLMAYAQVGIPAYWVVDLLDNVILVFEQPIPAEGRYEVTRTIALGQCVPLRLDGVLVAEIPAIDLLPIPR